MLTETFFNSNEGVKLQKDGEVAIVTLNAEGRVEVEKEGSKTVFRPTYTIDTVVTEFEKRGWKDFVPDYVREDVDAYLELHEEMSKLRKQMEGLKKRIRAFMDSEGVTSIRGTNGQEVYLQEAKASNSTSKYTDYELPDIIRELDYEVLKEVTEVRVNAEKLEGLLKTDKLPKEKVEEIKAQKIVRKGTPRFSVKK